jgi:hypothetical protein
MTSSHSTLHPLLKYARTGLHPIGYRKDGRPIFPMAGGSGNAMLERIVQEREQCVDRIEAVSAAALEASRDLSDQDTEVISRAKDRIAFLDRQAEVLAFDTQISERAANALRSNGVTVAEKGGSTQYRSAGEALYDLLHLDRGDSRSRLEREMSRAAQHIGVDAANTVAVAGGLGALVVKPVIGPVIDPTPGGRPFLTALGVQQLDSPLGFSRPRISDPNGDEAPDVQGVGTANAGREKAELVSRAFDVKLDPVDTETIGEYLNVSQKVLSLNIQALQIILTRFTKRRARKTEARAIAEVRTTTSTVPLAADADTRTTWDAFWDAAALVYEKTGEMPTWLAAGPQGWRRLGSMLDAADRPLFPTIGASNAMGAAALTTQQMIGPAGLNTVITHGITDGALIMGNSASLEAYEYAYPMLEAVEPSVLGRQIAVASELALYRPATDNMAGTATGNGAVLIAPAA